MGLFCFLDGETIWQSTMRSLPGVSFLHDEKQWSLNKVQSNWKQKPVCSTHKSKATEIFASKYAVAYHPIQLENKFTLASQKWSSLSG